MGSEIYNTESMQTQWTMTKIFDLNYHRDKDNSDDGGAVMHELSWFDEDCSNFASVMLMLMRMVVMVLLV